VTSAASTTDTAITSGQLAVQRRYGSGNGNGNGGNNGRNGSSNSNTGSGNTGNKLDKRFADEEDVVEITELMNAACAVECAGGGAMAFRSAAVMLTRERVASSIDSGIMRWYVLETPHPEERMVGCAGFKVESEPTTSAFGGDEEGNGDDTVRVGRISYLAVVPSDQGRGVGSHLIRSVENVLRSLGCNARAV
jgi:GNAT superfamily N-acetyltransferase